ncbi:MAG: hypothetical protein ISP72_09080, partial [Flavobacteriaceae bacterium]|nr:hypothetical protein [Flavobacteriaceae bacterium]
MKIITIYHYISRLLLLFLFLFTGLYTYGQVKIGENKTKISPYALLELESKDKALLVPRMTTAERDEAFSQESPEGLVIFNTDIGMIQYFFQDIDPLTGKKLNIKRWNSTGEEVHTSFPVTPRSGTLFYNEDSNILFAWNDNDKLWMPVNANIRSSITEIGVSDPSIDMEFEAFPPSENGKESLKEVLMGSGPPTTTIMKDNPSVMLYADSDRGSLYMALDTDNDGTPDKWKKIIVKSDPKPVDPPSDDQTIAARLNGLVLELLPENTTISTTVDLSSLVTQSTDDQSITATLSDTILKLTPENSNTTEVDLGVFTNTDNQKLSLTLLPNTTTQTLLQIENGGSVTLQASGNLSFREPRANVIEFTVSSTVSTLGDSDGDTTVEVEQGIDDDTIRLIAAGEEVTQV